MCKMGVREMYKLGDLIIYGRTGVCMVEDICSKRLSGEKEERLFYTLKPLYQKCAISTPVESKVFSRRVISAQEAKALIDSLPSLEAEPYHNRNLNQLREYYRQRIESFDCRELALLGISIHRKKLEAEAAKRKLGAVDERFMKEAEDLLFGELAAALGIQRSEVGRYIREAIAE